MDTKDHRAMNEDPTPVGDAFVQFVVDSAVRMLRETRDVDSVVRFLNEVAPGTLVTPERVSVDE